MPPVVSSLPRIFRRGRRSRWSPYPIPEEASLKTEPKQRLDPRAKLLWRVTGTLQAVPVVVGGVFGSYVLYASAEVALYLAVLPVLGALALAVLLVGLLPTLLWRRWRYEIRPLEIDLQRGLVQVPRTLVPMARVQHVDTRRGPLQRRLGLATVVFYTAAGPNEIPQLAQKTAAEVRDRIAELTRTADELSHVPRGGRAAGPRGRQAARRAGRGRRAAAAAPARPGAGGAL